MSDKSDKNIKKCSSLAEARSEIDLIDEAILCLIARRARYVRQVVRFKNEEDIVDEARIAAIIAKQKKDAQKENLPADMVEDIWRIMIDNFIKMERELMKKNNGAG